jgi:hypothetical protein
LLHESKFPNHTRDLISQGRFDHPILREYQTFFQCSLSTQQKNNAEPKYDFILSSFDFYLTIFVSSMKRLRKKIEDEPKEAKVISSNQGVTI